jgi:ABC-type antimicrobial peptide transport system permease subunit
MGDYVNDALAQTRFTLTLIGVFAALALTLASIGLYGVIAYSLRQRIQEFGVRMAFGAGSKNLVRLVLGHGMALALCGVGLGLVAALLLARAASSLLYGVTAMDPVTFAGTPLLLVGVTALASYIPARRATQIDPVKALRGGTR